MTGLPRTGWGMAMEQVGPDCDQPHPTVAQPGWPAGILDILGHPSRVYSFWVNGNETFYFQSKPAEMQELILAYSRLHLRDHVLFVQAGPKDTGTFKKDRIGYNLQFHLLDGIALAMTRQEDPGNTHEPTLTILVDPVADATWLRSLELPPAMIIENGLTNIVIKSRATRPERQVWHARVQFDDGAPAADFEHGVSARITLWENEVKTGVPLGSVSHLGAFQAAFSNREIEHLRSGHSHLTLTTGNAMTAVQRSHPRLPIERLVLDKEQAVPVQVSRPGYYHGRVLFEDGSPPVMDPVPWPGAEIHLSFSYAGTATPDSNGYFSVFFTPDQYAEACANKPRKNIYVPRYGETGRSTARAAYPVSELSRDKQTAGVIRIPRPEP